MPGLRGYVFWFVVGTLIFSGDVDASDISDIEADQSFPVTEIESDDGHATLRWARSFRDPSNIFQIVESGPTGRHVGLVEGTSLDIYRIVPGLYDFKVHSCPPDSNGFPQCENSAQSLSVRFTDEVDTLYDPLTRDSSDPDIQIGDVDETLSGPGQLRPGLWFNPQRGGHGWSFYWANRLGLSESHEMFGNEYDLLGVWYSFEARSRFIDGPYPCGEVISAPDCFWVYENYLPVVAKLKLIQQSENSYSGVIVITRNAQDEQVGTATVTFGSSNTTALVSWEASFKMQHLSSSDQITFLAGTADGSYSNITHYSGFWQATGREDLMIVEDVGAYSEAVGVIFEDQEGDPGWIQASNSGTPVTASTSLCFYSVSRGYAPDGTGSISIFNSGCDPSDDALDENRNGWRNFSDFEEAQLWLNFTLPAGLGDEVVSLGNASDPVELFKTISFHRISYSAPQGSGCEISGTTSDCAIQLSWFTDGDYPDAGIFDYNVTTGVRRKIAVPSGSAILDFPISVVEGGIHRFELRMGGNTASSLIAQSDTFTVTHSEIAAPRDFEVDWTDQTSRKFDLTWFHPDPGGVDWFEVEQQKPGSSQLDMLIVNPGSRTSLELERGSGPFGEYHFRIRACRTWSGSNDCSSWSAGLSWNVAEPEPGSSELTHPWASIAGDAGALSTDLGYSYAMGYHFRPEEDGVVAELGGLFNGSFPVRLYRKSDSKLLAETDVSAHNDWSYAAISPVQVHAGEEYTVAVYLDGSGGSRRSSVSLPASASDITILGSTYVYTRSNPDAIPVNLTTSSMYGQADIGFLAGVSHQNSPPAIDPAPSDQKSMQGQQVSLLIEVSDPDDDALTCSFNGLPDGLTESEECRVSGVVTQDPGVYEVSVTANDGQVDSQPVAFNWEITAAQSIATPDIPPNPVPKPSFTIDSESARIGATAGEASVDASGAANYSIPLMTAPGSGGVVPELSLDYSSQFPNGVIGMGWSIGGVSSISRCAQTMEQDGTRSSTSINLDYDDRFCLDGQRLVLVDGQYGKHGSEYRTEIDVFLRIRAYGNAGNGPEYFKVWTRDGALIEYGRTNDSRIEARATGNMQTAVTWTRNRLENVTGNYVLYEYEENATGPVGFSLSVVRYTGNIAAGTSTYAEIRFFYSTGREDTSVSYLNSASFSTTRLLTRIDSVAKVRASDSAMQSLRSYFLEYGEDGFGRKTLESFVECRDTSKTWCFPATTFSWLKNEHGIEGSSVSSKQLTLDDFQGLSIADVNGDGRPDLLITQINGDLAYFKIAFALGDGGFTVNPKQYNLATHGENQTPVKLHAIDLNADSYQDVIYPKTVAGTVSWYARISNGSYLGDELKVADDCCRLNDPSMARIMDYDGDGLADLVTILHSTGNDDNGDLVVLRNGYKPGGVPGFLPHEKLQIELVSDLFPEGPIAGGWQRDDEAPQFINLNPSSAVGAQPFDFNGDGRVDLLVKLSRRYKKCDVYCPLPIAPVPWGPVDSSSRFNFSDSDVPPDGATGKGIQYATATFYVVFESSGNGTFKEHSVLAVGAGEDCPIREICTYASDKPDAKKLAPVDVNADGLADVVFMDQEFDWYFMLNVGGSFLQPQLVARPAIDDDSEKGRFIDLNGDGFADFAYPDSSRTVWIKHTNDFGKAFAAPVTTKIAYRDSSSAYPNILLDFTGDGVLDNLMFRPSSYPGSSTNSSARATWPRMQLGENLITGKTAQAANVIASIRNGLGAVSYFSYLPLSDSDVYSRMQNSKSLAWGNNSSVYDLMAPVYVVRAFSQSAPVYGNPDALSTTEFHYVGGKIQAGGRGFLGFAEVISYDPHNEIRTNTRYRQDFPFTGLVADKATTKTDSAGKFKSITDVRRESAPGWPTINETTQIPLDMTGNIISYEANEWASRETVAGKKVYSRQLVATMDRSYSLAGQLKRKDLTTAQFGAYDQVTSSQTKTWGGESGSPMATQNTLNAYTQVNLSDWNLGQISSTQVTHSRPGTATVTRSSGFEYDTVSRQLRRQIAEPGDPSLKLVHNYQHDEFGNRISVSTSGPDFSTRVHTFVFDPLGRYVEREINGFGQVTHQVLLRDVFGSSLRTTNIDGVQVDSGRDPMGRPLISYSETGSWKKSVFRSGTGSYCPSATTYSMTDTGGGNPAKTTCFDRLGRQIRVATESFGGGVIVIDQYFDHSGRIDRESTPAFLGKTQFWTTQMYDALGRPIFTNSAAGDDLAHAWDESAGNQCASGGVRRALSRNALGQEKLEVRNALGETVEVYDDQCGLITYRYDAMGQLVVTKGVDGHEVRIGYDRAGRKVLLDDPDKGIWGYAYNALGELVRHLDDKGQAIDFDYDRAGRVTDRRELSGVLSLTSSYGKVEHHEETSWINDTGASVVGKSKVAQIVYREGERGEIVHQKNVIYDDFGRATESLTLINGHQFTESSSFDQFGRPFQQFDASGDSRGIRFVYRQNGYLERVREAREGSEGTVYQQIKAMDALGNITAMELGNGVEVFASYDPKSGFVEKLEAYDVQGVELQEVDYLFDALGSLQQRHDLSNGLDVTENYIYDELNRLERVELIAPADHIHSPVETMRLDYDAAGNIVYKSDVGQYSYGQGNAGPHAVTSAGGDTFSYDENGNQVSGAGRSITYSVFEKPLAIIKGSQETAFEYGIGNQRITRTDNNDIDGLQSTTYLGSVKLIEKDGSRKFRRSLAGVANADYFPATGIQSVQYFVKDHLGSIHSVTDESGRIGSATRMSFDAFGQRRDISWQNTLNNTSTRILNQLTSRGFTGHEHVDSMGIIHMNGRIYDPKLGRFLQADPLVQAPKNGQNLNRYSYVLNNPLSYTDPSGYFSLKRFIKRWGPAIVAAVASYITFGAATAWAWGLMPSTAAGVATSAAYSASTVIGGAISGFLGGAIVGRNLKGAVRGAFTGAAIAFLGSQIKVGLRNWKSGRGQLYRVTRDPISGDLIAQHIGDPKAAQIERLFVNGQSNDLAKAMTLGYQQLGKPAEFFLFHNPTHGIVADTIESVLGKITNTSGVSRHLAEIIETQAKSLINITAHSQGGIIVSNALRHVSRDALSSGTIVNFNGAAVGKGIHSRTTIRAGATPGIYQANTFDLIPNVIGMATYNPFKILGSFILSPLLVTPMSQHTVYSP